VMKKAVVYAVLSAQPQVWAAHNYPLKTVDSTTPLTSTLAFDVERWAFRP